jgi:hypothetical protein
VREGVQKQRRHTSLKVRLRPMAEWTGLEPATPGVTGRYSNQLNYHSQLRLKKRIMGAEGFEPPTFAL